MRELLSANIRHHGRRYVATGLAVVIAVVFVVMVLALGNSMGAAFGQTFSEQYSGADAVIQPSQDGPDAPLPAESQVIQEVSSLPEVGAVAPIKALELEFDGGAALGRDGTSQGWVTELKPPPFSQPQLREGALPDSPDQIALDVRTARAMEIGVGDTIQARSLFGGSDRQLTVVGICGKPENSLMNVSNDAGTMTAQGIAALDESGQGAAVSAYLVSAADGHSPDAVTGAVNNRLGADSPLRATTATEAIDQAMEGVNLQVAQMNVVLMVFPAIAIVVAIIVISTTFQVIVQQRQRELGLLRCIGASRRQIRRLIVGETVAVGAIASLIGVILGAVLAALGVTAIGLLPSFGAGLSAIGWPIIASVFAAGILITVIAGFRPAARVGRIPPLAALSPAATNQHTRSAGWWTRLVLGALVTIGSGGLMVAIAPQQTNSTFVAAIGLGLAAMFGMVLFLSAVFPGLVGIVTLPLRGMIGRMASGNAVRNPGRTSATGVSVVIGVTLIVMMMVGASSLRSMLAGELDSRMATDLTATSSSGDPLTQNDADAIASVSGVAKTAVELGLTQGTTLAGDPVVVYDVDAVHAVARSSLATPRADEVLVAPGSGLDPGTDSQLCGQAGCVDVTVVADSSWDAEYGRVGVSSELMAQLGGSPQVLRVLAQLDNTSDFQIVSADISRLGHSYELGGAAQMRAMFDQMINLFLTVVVALLGVSVLVALVGVSNTMSLSVAERTRENGLLRALGMTRRQVGRMLTLEAVVISLTAALLGTLAGMFFGWIGINALPMSQLDSVPLVVPWWQVLAVLAVAMLASVVASWLPGRRAGRTSPVEALAAE